MAKIGRPLVMSVDDRRQEIFNIAEKLFGEQGFEHVTMSQIAAAAGMSKKTLYVYFSDKRQLLESLVESSYIWSDDTITISDEPPMLALAHNLKRIVQHVLSERHIKLCRLAIAEHVQLEGSTAIFYEMGISTSRNHLIAALQNIPRDQYKLNFDAEVMADLLFGALIAKPFIDLLLIGQAQAQVNIEQKINHVLKNLFHYSL